VEFVRALAGVARPEAVLDPPLYEAGQLTDEVV
jgi:hypothetical protein